MLKISLMDHSDLDSAYEIEKQVNPSPWSKDNFYSSFDIGHHSLVCRIDSKIIGFVIFSLIKQESHLLNIGVAKNWQRKGAGAMLLKSLIKQSKVLGAKKVFLEVRSKNDNAIFFYTKYNFLKDAIRANYYSGSDPDDAILMSLEI